MGWISTVKASIANDESQRKILMKTESTFHQGAVEAKLKLAEEVLTHSNDIVQLTIKALLSNERDAKRVVKEQAEHWTKSRALIQSIAGRLTSGSEKDLFALASPRWSSVATQQSQQTSAVADANQAAPSLSEMLLPALVDNACWRSFIELLRAELAASDAQGNGTTAIAQRAAELVRSNHQLRSTIAEQKRVQERLCQLASIVDSSTDAIVVQTIGGTIASWNVGAERLYGYAAHEILGKQSRVLLAVDRWDELPKALQAIARGDAIPVHESVHIRKNGESMIVSTALSPVRDAEGEVIGAAAITRNTGNQ